LELRIAIPSVKRRIDLQEDPRAGIREASKRNVQRVVEDEKPDLVEGSASSRVRK
jgi:hypothetical protein